MTINISPHILSLKGQRVNEIKLAEDGERVVIHCARDARRSAIDPTTGKKGRINQQGYRVRSLYFDSIDDDCLFQKQSGNLLKKNQIANLWRPIDCDRD